MDLTETDEPFESPKLLLAGAKENLRDFDARYKTFLESRPYTTASDFDAKTGNKLLKLKATAPIPGEMRLAMSNGLNNMRHALDQAVNDAAVLLRGGARNCYFPFAKDAGEFATIFQAKRYKTVPPEVRPYITALQPHFGGDDILYALSKLTGPNKHQVVLRLYAEGQDSVGLGNMVAKGPVQILPPKWDRANNEMVFMVLEPGAEVKFDVSFTPLVAIRDPIASSLKPAGGLADAFLGVAERVVLGLETETHRLLAERQKGQAAPPAAGAA